VLREKFMAVVRGSKLWDRKVLAFQMTNAGEETVELRGLCSARNSGDVFDLQCEARETLIAFMQAEYPNALPRRRQEAIGRPSPPIAPDHPDESRVASEAQNRPARKG
jgi:hypothetical protein